MNLFNDTEHNTSLVSPTLTRSPLSREEVQRQKSKADNVTWFTHGEFIWRSGASIVWLNLFILPVVCILYITVASFSLLHPIRWITDLITNVFSVWNLFVYIFIFGIIITPVVLINIKICSVELRFGITRMSAIASFLTVKHVCNLVLCAITGSVGCWWVSSLTYPNYGTFTKKCLSLCNGESLLCLNEPSLFLLVFGAVLGVLYAILFFQERHHQITFPVAQQERVFRVKACLIPSFWHAVVICLKSLQMCYPMYFLFGFFPKHIVRITTGFERDRQLHSLDSLYGLLDFRLFWFCFATGTLVAYVWILANKFVIIVHTEVLRFPIQAAFAEQSDQSLPVVLKCQTIPLLKYLAFNDLCQLSQFSAKRRKQIFSLSIPGGRPLNWLWVSNECLTLLNELKERLTEENNNNQSLSVRKHTDSVWITPSRTLRDMNGRKNSIKKTTSDSFINHRTSNSNTPTTKQSRDTPTISQSRDTPHDESLTKRSQIKEPAHMKFSEKVKRIQLVQYFLEKREDVEMEDLFYDAQLQMWSAEALSRLVAASFTEDVFGVVQKTLPFILSSLLELLQAVEIYLKRPLSQQNLFRIRHPSGIRKTVYVLRDTLRCSIYRITKTFQQHLSDIELTTNNKEFLKSFLKFQE